uniref:Eclosion hormone n=1 Tax=Amphibalanus amphitrite TaxID=1232801 RepID=I3VN99_AMPAM|nr:eclosion hormone [Amphibalanus amphitrite]
MNRTESLLVLCGAIVVLLLSGPAQASIGSCVRNCGQCKSMYGRFFQGTACADACLAGNEGPDCYNPSMVSRFLKRRASPVVPASPGLASLGGSTSTTAWTASRQRCPFPAARLSSECSQLEEWRRGSTPRRALHLHYAFPIVN